jgi:hypothetical protein
VRWIETQDLFFEQYKFECFVKIGPSPTLIGMAIALKANMRPRTTQQVVFAASLAYELTMLTHGCLGKYMKELVGRTEIEEALGRLDQLTQDEVRMAAAQGLKATHEVDNKVQAIEGTVHAVDDKVKTVEGNLRRR